MNEVVNKYLLTGDRFMPKLHLKQPVFTYSPYGAFMKHRKRIQKFKGTCDLKYIFKNKLDKACFAHNAAYANSKDLAKRTVSDNMLKDRAYEIALNPNCDGYQRGLTSMMYKLFDKKLGSRAISKVRSNVNEVLAQELHKPVIKKFKRRKLYARFKDNIWAVDLPEMVSLSSKNQIVKYLLCAINAFTKYAWVKPLKDKKAKIVFNGFTGIVNECKRKPNKLWMSEENNFTITSCKNSYMKMIF